MSEARIIQLPGDKRKWVVGMRWRHEDRAPATKTLRAAAKERGRWVCRRRTSLGSYQTGFGMVIAGRKVVALQSLAALVADAKPEPWLGIFDLGDGLYWYIAVRDNQEILPDGDVFGNAATISEARARHASLGEWSYEDGDASDLLRLIMGSKRACSVVDIESNPWLMPIVGGGALILASTAGLMLWQRHEHALVLRQQQNLARQRAVQAAMAAKAPKVATILPWTQLASATDFLQTCGHAFDATPLAQDGWVLSAWGCLQAPGGRASVDLTWARAGGTDLRTPDGLLSGGGNTVRKVLPLASRLPLDAGAILASDPAERAIRGMAQTLALPLTLTSPAPIQPAAGLPGAAPSVRPAINTHPWSVWTVGLELPAPPWTFDIQHPSDAVAGLRWQRIAWDGTKWTLSGSMYVSQPTSPAPAIAEPTNATPPTLSTLPPQRKPANNPMPAPMHAVISSGVPHAN